MLWARCSRAGSRQPGVLDPANPGRWTSSHKSDRISPIVVNCTAPRVLDPALMVRACVRASSHPSPTPAQGAGLPRADAHVPRRVLHPDAPPPTARRYTDALMAYTPVPAELERAEEAPQTNSKARQGKRPFQRSWGRRRRTTRDKARFLKRCLCVSPEPPTLTDRPHAPPTPMRAPPQATEGT